MQNSAKKKGLGSSNREKVGNIPPVSGSSNSYYSTILIFLFVCVCFCGGVFLGSHITRTSRSLRIQSNILNQNAIRIGLPGTRNLLKKWNNSGNLRTSGDTATSQSPVSVMKSPELVAAKLAIESSQSKPVSNKDSSHIDMSTITYPSDKSLSLHATSSAFMIAPKNLDRRYIVITAWIYLENLEIDSHDMRTIFSNKATGCDHTSNQYGVSLFVNAWQTNDRKLYAEYGGRNSGCYKIDSGSIQLEPSRWYHVGVSFSGDYGRLFIDGKVVGQTLAGAELHIEQTDKPFLIGQYENGEYPFMGNISNIAIVSDPPGDENELLSTIETMKDSKTVDGVDGLVAHYSLAEAANLNAKIAYDSSPNKLHGTYNMPPSGSTVAGVRIPLIDGTNGAGITAEEMRASDDKGRQRSQNIKQAMKRVWSSYRKYAWGEDELKPKSHTGDNNWGGMGVTLVDSLDTLWLMGLEEEFNDAKNWVQKSLTFRNAGTISVFETTIRELGGLIAAYDLSGDQIFLDKARELGDLLLPAFDSSSGIPFAMINLQGHQGVTGWAGSTAILSELGSLQLEFRYLSYKLKDPKFETKAMKPLKLMRTKRPAHGLYPIKVNMRDGSFADSQVTFGALGDSFYEYLLKVWIQGGKKEQWLRDMYDEAINGVIDVLLQASSPSGLAFLGDWNGHNINRKMDHLVCFMPGTMALGAMHDPKGKDSDRAKRDLAVAKALMYTCREMYHRMESGISAEYVEFPPRQDITVPGHVAFYILRPETAESLFYLNQLTGDPIYREWAWEIWEAIDKHCKTDIAYASLRNIHNPSQGVDDRMESFFLAETIKYLYLVQDPDNAMRLNEYVFNTEAHPTKIFADDHVPVKE